MQEEIIVENGIKSILQKIFDYYYSYKRTCKTAALGELLQNENYIRMAEGGGSATLYRIDFTRNLNLVVKIVGEGNSEVVDDYSIICMHGGRDGLSITHNSGPSSIRMYRDNDYN